MSQAITETHTLQIAWLFARPLSMEMEVLGGGKGAATAAQAGGDSPDRRSVSMPQLSDYKIVLYRQPDGSWVAYVPALPGCHSIMPDRDEALAELETVFEMIREEYEEEGKAWPQDVELIHA